MRMYKTDDIIEILQDSKECDNKYVGFEVNDKGNLIITLKEHAPGWRDSEDSVKPLRNLNFWRALANINGREERSKWIEKFLELIMETGK